MRAQTAADALEIYVEPAVAVQFQEQGSEKKFRYALMHSSEKCTFHEVKPTNKTNRL
jgi:hypothetical protein